MKLLQNAIILVASAFSSAAQGTIPKSNQCTIVAESTLFIETNDDDAAEITFECIIDSIDSGEHNQSILPIILTDSQRQLFHNKLENGELISGVSTLKFEQEMTVSNEGILIPTSKNSFAFGTIGEGGINSRHLITTTGEKKFLVVKVVDSEGRALNESAGTISNDIFGPTDTMTLKSQMEACSYGKVKILPGVGSPNEISNGHNSPGVIQVQIDISLLHSRSTVRNAVDRKVEEVLGISLPGPYSHVMYVLKGCYHSDCSWAAYASVNSWWSVYQGKYYKMVGVQMHGKFHHTIETMPVALKSLGYLTFFNFICFILRNWPQFQSCAFRRARR